MAKRTPILWAVGFLAVLILIAVLGALRFERQITLTFLNPDRSYEAYTPPPAPDYEEDGAWFLRGQGEAEAAAFIVHANVFRSSEEWNAAASGTEQEAFLQRRQVPADTAPFAGQASLYVPRYRQPNIFARFTQKHPGAAARLTAYADIEASFELFLREIEPGAPIVMAGYDDGALLIGRLWLERIENDEQLRERVAGVYVIGMPVARSAFARSVCKEQNDARCVLGFAPVDRRFSSYQERLRTRTLTLSRNGRLIPALGVRKLCALPPLPASVEAFAGPERPAVPFAHRGRCEDGLFVHAVPPDDLRRASRFGGPWFPNGTNLFAGPLRADVSARLNALKTLRADEAAEAEEARKRALIAPPMEAAEDLREVPVNKVPGGN